MGRTPPFHDIAQMRDAARRALPRFAFDFIDGGAHGEQALARNRTDMDALRLVPRILAGNETRDPSVTLFGRRYAGPLGIAPIGMAGVVRPGIDLALARAAARLGLPYALSTAGSATIEAVAEAAPESWFQLYVGRDAPMTDDLIERADRLGVPALIVTADAPTPGLRRRDSRNGFSLPLRLSAGLALDIVAHPIWGWRMWRGGAPRFANLERYNPPGTSTRSLAAFMAGQSCARLDWGLLARIRERWRRPLILKGVMHPDDAVRARKLGVDAICVSNHGGRQLDAAPSPVAMLPAIRAALPRPFPLLLDSGVRSGEDIARALALGADLVLLGRPFLFATAALGLEDGPARLAAMLLDELDRAMGQLGAATADDLHDVEVADARAAPAAAPLRDAG